MKKYLVLLKFDNGNFEERIIEATNQNDARWLGKKVEGVYECVVLNRVKKRKLC